MAQNRYTFREDSAGGYLARAAGLGAAIERTVAVPDARGVNVGSRWLEVDTGETLEARMECAQIRQDAKTDEFFGLVETRGATESPTCDFVDSPKRTVILGVKTSCMHVATKQSVFIYTELEYSDPSRR